MAIIIYSLRLVHVLMTLQICGEAALPTAQLPRCVSQHVLGDPLPSGRPQTTPLSGATGQGLPQHAHTQVGGPLYHST